MKTMKFETSEFAARHLGPRPHDVGMMLKDIGVSSIDQLIDETVPQAIRTPRLAAAWRRYLGLVPVSP